MTTYSTPDRIRLLLISSDPGGSAEVETTLHQSPGLLSRVWHSTHPGDAVQTLLDLDGRVDVVMLDHNLVPEADASGAMGELREADGRVPIIIFNAPALLDRTAELLAAGAIACISRQQVQAGPERLRASLVKAIVRQQAMLDREEHMRSHNVHLRELSYRLKNNFRRARHERDAVEREKRELVSWMNGDYMMQK